jgi:hypothetical protein
VNLTSDWRVVAADGQWILETRYISKGEAAWRGRSFCITRDKLLACIVEHVLGIPASAGTPQQLARVHKHLDEHAHEFAPGALATVMALPGHIRDARS